MADDTPSVAKSLYPAFLGYAFDDIWDQGTEPSPNSQYVDAWWLSQIQSEILKHQQLLQAGAAQLFSPELMGTPGTAAAEITELQEAAMMEFVDAGTREIILNAQVLAASTDVVIVWCAVPITGDARWSVEYREADDDDPMNAAWEAPVAEDSTVSGVSYGQVKATVSLTGLTVGNTLMIKISRLPGHANDDLGASAYVAMVKLQSG